MKVDMIEFIGWCGSILFAICGIPQAYKSYVEGHSDGISWAFLILWLFGEFFTIIYIWPKQDIPLLINYLLNLVWIAVLVKYKIFPRK